ncbi:MAG: oligoendopeptidase F, partial [Alphaproteobacteria bacterium]|nr:oligoendopeptidase F [Alphaproteobacteria bacterium]
MELGALPRWDLADLYPGIEAAELSRDLTRAAADAEAFNGDFLGRVDDLAADDLAAAIERYEAIKERLGRISSYAQLCHAGQMDDPGISRFFQTARERVTDITSKLLFFRLEVNRIEPPALEAAVAASPRLARYAPWLRDTRAFRPHQLPDDQERLLHEKQVAGSAAWMRLFDETLAAMRFDVAGEEMSLEQTLHQLSEPAADRRQAAAKALGAAFAERKPLFALITNTLAKDKEIEDKWRRFETPEAARHLGNHVEGEVVEALRSAVVEAYPRLAHRYYRLKAGWFGQEALDYWDRNAPLPKSGERSYPFEEARDIVLAAYAGFSPELAGIGRWFFEHDWIDAEARPGKSPGAFAHPTVPSAHP